MTEKLFPSLLKLHLIWFRDRLHTIECYNEMMDPVIKAKQILCDSRNDELLENLATL